MDFTYRYLIEIFFNILRGLFKKGNSLFILRSKIMIKILILIFLAVNIYSCGTNKVTVEKEKVPLPVKESINLTTDDKLNIKGFYYFNDKNKNEKQPLVILIHQLILLYLKNIFRTYRAMHLLTFL